VNKPSSGAEAAGLSATLGRLLTPEFRADPREAGTAVPEEIADLRLREQARRILAQAEKFRRSPD
jgi:hypothetical protein